MCQQCIRPLTRREWPRPSHGQFLALVKSPRKNWLGRVGLQCSKLSGTDSFSEHPPIWRNHLNRRATDVGWVSRFGWGGTVKRPNTENFQPPKNKLVSQKPYAHTTNSSLTSISPSSSSRTARTEDHRYFIISTQIPISSQCLLRARITRM